MQSLQSFRQFEFLASCPFFTARHISLAEVEQPPLSTKGTRRSTQIVPRSAVSRTVADASRTKPGLFKFATFRQ